MCCCWRECVCVSLYLGVSVNCAVSAMGMCDGPCDIQPHTMRCTHERECRHCLQKHTARILCYVIACAHTNQQHKKKTARTPCARRSCLRRMIYRFITGVSIYADARPVGVAVAVAVGVAHSKARLCPDDKRLTSAARMDAHARASKRAMCFCLRPAVFA